MAVKHSNGETTFICEENPDAKRVYLAGDFNNWDADAKRMVKVKGGTFNARVRLQPGQHQYKFVIDGQWVADSTAEGQCATDIGTTNSIVTVP